ncbi:MAG TPA: GGDEF domain-containing protein [Deinococcales bacterium]|nr:GGDEF domain-containing protein [Deinococcales bacterium]
MSLTWPVIVVMTVPVVAAAALAFMRPGALRERLGWVASAMDVVVLAVFMRAAGGLNSHLEALAYLWLAGTTVLQLRHGEVTPLPLMTFAAWAAVMAGGLWTGADPHELTGYVVVHTLGMGLAGLLAATISRERQRTQTDPMLPAVLTRAAGLERLEGWVRQDRAFHIAFVDLTDFKGINDRHGHLVGDEVLRAVAERLRAAVRADDITARFGGDEFIVASLKREALERLPSVLERPVRTARGIVPLLADIGLDARRPGEPLDAVLERADQAMYHGKRNAKAERQALAASGEHIGMAVK